METYETPCQVRHAKSSRATPRAHARSALLPMLHLVQSEDGYVSANGIALCAELLGITRAEVSAVATFYTQYKRHPTGEYLVGVCTNALCAVMGGDEIWEAVSEKVGVGTDETNEAGTITLERLECKCGLRLRPRCHGELGVLRQPDP